MLVTGGAGFIGSHLCERLATLGEKVISLDNYFTGLKANHFTGVEYRHGHTKNIERFMPERPDIIYHLGEYPRVEQSFDEPALVFDLNIVGTFAVLEFCRKRKIKIVYAGSSTKFSDGGSGRDISPYAWMKATNVELVKNYGRWYGVPYTIAYLYNVYGPRERAGRHGSVIEIFRRQHIQGEVLGVRAPGTQRRNFTHVADTVDGLMLAGDKGEGDDFNIANDESYSILEVAALFGGAITMLPPHPGNRTESTVSSEKMRTLGWKLKHNLKDYIRDCVEGVKANTKS